MEIIAKLIGALSFLVNIYMVIIFIRIILTWVSWIESGGFQNILAKITDPYLNWFRRFTFLRVGFLDLSPIAALGVLTLVNRILGTLAYYGTISVGIILAIIIQVLWGAVSFFLCFLIIVLLLRLVAFLLKQNLYNSFWRIIDTISRPILFRINRILFRNRIVNFRNGVILSIVVLGILYLLLRVLVSFLSVILARLPV